MSFLPTFFLVGRCSKSKMASLVCQMARATQAAKELHSSNGPAGWLRELLDGSADVGLAFAARGEPDRDDADEEVQDAAHGKTGTGHQLERTGVGDVFGDVRGVLEFSFDGRSLNLLGGSAGRPVPTGSCIFRNRATRRRPGTAPRPLGGPGGGAWSSGAGS